jgi:hypothetical protein
MEKEWKIYRFLSLAILIVSFSVPALATDIQKQGSYDNMDADNDGMISLEEVDSYPEKAHPAEKIENKDSTNSVNSEGDTYIAPLGSQDFYWNDSDKRNDNNNGE